MFKVTPGVSNKSLVLGSSLVVSDELFTVLPKSEVPSKLHSFIQNCSRPKKYNYPIFHKNSKLSPENQYRVVWHDLCFSSFLSHYSSHKHYTNCIPEGV